MGIVLLFVATALNYNLKVVLSIPPALSVLLWMVLCNPELSVCFCIHFKIRFPIFVKNVIGIGWGCHESLCIFTKLISTMIHMNGNIELLQLVRGECFSRYLHLRTADSMKLQTS